jgi:trimeric autotransporter adhesin
MIDSTGHLGTIVSSARYKENIQPMDNASETILALQPVTFRYKKALDPKAIPQFGLVAEQVEKVNPDLVARDDQGKPYSVRYEAVNAMLLNEFLKEHRKVESLDETVAQQHLGNAKLQKEVAALQTKLATQRQDFETLIAQQHKQIGELTAGLQKVTARLESSPSAAKLVADN